MRDQFVTFEIAERLARLGFDLPCFGFYHPSLVNPITMLTTAIDYIWDSSGHCNNTRLKKRSLQPQIAAGTYSQVIDWFRVNYGYHIFIERDSEMWMVRIQDLNNENYDGVLEVELSGETHYREYLDAKIALTEYICEILETKES